MDQEFDGELGALRARVEEWRKACAGRRARIPDDVWGEAVRVARTSGVNATARACRFDYVQLKRRVERAAVAREEPRDAAILPGESESSELLTSNGERRVLAKSRTDSSGGKSEGSPFIPLELARGRAGNQTVVEFESRHGDRMRVEVDGTVDVAALVEFFWRHES